MALFDRFPVTVCGIPELPEHAEASHVLSILDPDHPVPDAFGRYGEHARLELRFHDITEETEGMVAPQLADLAALLAFGRDLMAEPPASARLLVHCHAGISRSTAAMALILAEAQPDLPAEDLMQGLLAMREKAWPNLRMLEMGDAMLGRGGTLPKAAVALYRHQLQLRPHLVEVMRGFGRGREVALGLTA